MKKIIILIPALLAAMSLYPAAGRKIAVLTYSGPVQGFMQSDCVLPIELSRMSRWPQFPNPERMTPERRFTLTVDPEGEDRIAFYKTSEHQSLPAARDALAKQEGSPNRTNIAYLRKLRAGEIPEANETFRDGDWVGYILQLPEKSDHLLRYASEITQWADRFGYNGVIWPSLPINIPAQEGLSRRDSVMHYLNNDPLLLENTQAYIRNQYTEFKTALMNSIESGARTTPIYDRQALLQAADDLDFHIPYHRGRYVVFTSNRKHFGPDDLPEWETYKIHLMPQDYSLEKVREIARIIKHSPAWQYIDSLKVFDSFASNNPISDGQNFPLIVIYTIGKEETQKVLNELYPLLKHIKGSGIKPRFNAKVNDLVWVAQGNGSRKERFCFNYEEPERIYCKSTYPDPANPKNYYLSHPETGQALTSGTDDNASAQLPPIATAGTAPSERNIAILAYGSVINNPGDMQIKGPFKKTPFGLPIRLSRASRWPGFPNPARQTDDRRFSLTIDSSATPEPLYYAESTFSSIPAAREDLRVREGSPNRNNIAYLRKLHEGQEAEEQEAYRNGTWAGYLLQLDPAYADAIVAWADSAGFDAVIWTSLPANVTTESGALEGRAVLHYLSKDPVLLRNTQEYIRNLPADIKTPLLRRIEGGTFAGAPGRAVASSSSQPAIVPAVRVLDDTIDTTYLFAHRGNLPVLITAPHGGRTKVPGVAKRTQPDAIFAWDHNSDHLANAIGDALEQITGAKPYVVVAKFHRDQIDGNRSPNQAYEDNRAKPIYDAFHKQIADYATEMKERYGDDIIHFDIHGQGVDRKTIYRGTRNRTLAEPLIRRKGEDAFTGPHSALGQLEQKGYTLFPKNSDRPAREYGPFTGGYIVGHYSKQFDIPSIQLETGGWHRDMGNISQVGRDTAASIAHFLNYYNYPL